jgi:8-oxo-dGTP pyrophosphatase MutT (NUDIX family)
VDAATHRVRIEVQTIEPYDDLERAHQADTLAWIRSGAEIFRREKPATPPKHVVSYVAPFDGDARALLLADHRLAGRWLAPGGHVEAGEHPRTTAVREAQEELGISAVFAASIGSQPFFLSLGETVGMTAGHVDVSLWYVIEASVRDRLTPDQSEFRSVEWWPIDRILDEDESMLGPHLRRFVRKLAFATATE